jgi:DNA-binding SARP family transcriptional activator
MILPHDSAHCLKALGGATIFKDGSSFPALAGRRRLLALLALVCSAGERGLSRGRAIAAFWPDRDEAHARNDLKQLVFVARRTLGDDLFISDAAALIIDPAVLPSDVEAVQRASHERRFEDVVRLYGGPFLDGFHIGGRPELERTVEKERERFAEIYSDALESLAGNAEADGDMDVAARWWRLLVELDPVRDEYAMGYMGAMADCGDVARALMYAQRYARVVRTELDEELSPQVVRFVKTLGARSRRRSGEITGEQRIPAGA